MSDDDDDRGKHVARPWESEESEESDSEGSLDGLDSGPTTLDDFTDDDYLNTTTKEYEGLAASVAHADTQEFERHAVAAAIPGVASGLVDFEDVTGEKGLSETDVELEEQKRTSDLALRIGSALVLAAVFIGSLLLGGPWFPMFVGFIMVVALGEFYSSVRTVGYNPLALFGLLGVVGGAAAAHAYGSTGLYGWVVVTAAFIALFYSVAARRHPLDNLGVTVLGLVWISLLGFAIVIGRSEFAVPLVLLVVLGTAAFDIGAYFVGKTFGSRPLAPSVSPNKTVEGLVGGVALSVSLLAVLSTFPVFDPLDVVHAIYLAAGICVLAPLGDAAESVLKRAIGVKDMGSIMPGHGGILDRIDALLFVAPFAYYLFDVLDYL